MNENYKELHESIEKNRELLLDIKDHLNRETTELKLNQQKLKFMIYGVISFLLIYIGKPEIITAILGV